LNSGHQKLCQRKRFQVKQITLVIHQHQVDVTDQLKKNCLF
jgi:hypothetical protein